MVLTLNITFCLAQVRSSHGAIIVDLPVVTASAVDVVSKAAPLDSSPAMVSPQADMSENVATADPAAEGEVSAADAAEAAAKAAEAAELAAEVAAEEAAEAAALRERAGDKAEAEQALLRLGPPPALPQILADQLWVDSNIELRRAGVDVLAQQYSSWHALRVSRPDVELETAGAVLLNKSVRDLLLQLRLTSIS